MKRIIYILVFFIITVSSFAQQDTAAIVVKDIKETNALEASDNEVVQAGIVAYNEGNFPKAIELFEDEISKNKKEGLESPALLYNLGNAYFRMNELGKARLNYERAALLDPSDRDIQHNIEYVTTRIEDKILEVDTLFLSVWFKAVQNIFTSNTWTVVGIVLFLLFIGSLFAFFFTSQIIIKKTSFYIGIVVVIFCMFANIFAYRQKQNMEKRDTAVVMAASVSVVSSPDINSKELFRLHIGTKVSITKDDRNWLEIEIDNGSVGWVQRDKIEII